MNSVKNFFIGIWNFISQITVELAWKAAAGILALILFTFLLCTKNTDERTADLWQAVIYVAATALLVGAIGVLKSLKDGRIDQPERDMVIKWTIVAFCLSTSWALAGILFGCTSGALGWLMVIDGILAILGIVLGIISYYAPVTPTPGTTTTPVTARKRRVSLSTLIILLLLAGFVISMYSRTMRATAKYDGKTPPTDTVVVIKEVPVETPPAPEKEKVVKTVNPPTPEPETPTVVGPSRTWGEE